MGTSGRECGVRDGTKSRHGAWFAALVAAAIGIAASAGPATSATIAYQATDLADVGPFDLWEYTYSVSGADFDAGVRFSILFPVGDTRELEASGSVAEWSVLVIQPDPLLADEGRYEAAATIDGAQLADPFRVLFRWSGSGDPGAQRFEIFDASFQIIEIGETIPVPEPTSLALLALGLLGFARCRRGSASRCS